MRRGVYVLAIALVVTLFTAVSAVADASPKAIVQSIISKMQATKSPVPVLDFVHWPSAYGRLSDQEKTQMNVSSESELKSFYKTILTDPASYMRTQLEARLSQFPEDQRAQMKAQVEQMMTMVNQRVKQMEERIAGTSYQIGDESISGDTAEVPLTTKFGTEEKSDTIRFVRIDGKWYLPAVQMAQPSEGGAPAGGAPTGPPAGVPGAR